MFGETFGRRPWHGQETVPQRGSRLKRKLSFPLRQPPSLPGRAISVIIFFNRASISPTLSW